MESQDLKYPFWLYVQYKVQSGGSITPGDIQKKKKKRVQARMEVKCLSPVLCAVYLHSLFRASLCCDAKLPYSTGENRLIRHVTPGGIKSKDLLTGLQGPPPSQKALYELPHPLIGSLAHCTLLRTSLLRSLSPPCY